MTKLLIIKAHPLTARESTSMRILEAFMDAYKQHHRDSDVEVLDLFDSYIPEVDATLLSSWDLLKNGADFQQLTTDQQQAVTRFNELNDQFIAADKIVIANALWNLNIPTRLKAWIDTVNVSGKTFKYTVDGPVPLTSGKKVLHIQSNGGSYGGQDFSSQFLKAIMIFVGVTDYQQLFIEGIDHYPEKSEQILTTALTQAKELAKKF